MSENSEQKSREWIKEAEAALERTGEALRKAWSETKDTRMATLEAARNAATRLGEAIDQGIGVAKETWSSARPAGEDDSADDPAGGEGASEEE